MCWFYNVGKIEFMSVVKDNIFFVISIKGVGKVNEEDVLYFR